VTLFGKEHRWSLSCKLIEVANEVGLVVVATFESDRRPATIALFNGPENLLKSEYSTKQFWSETNLPLKAALQLSIANTRDVSEVVH
jgi:hypothetical protein